MTSLSRTSSKPKIRIHQKTPLSSIISPFEEPIVRQQQDLLSHDVTLSPPSTPSTATVYPYTSLLPSKLLDNSNALGGTTFNSSSTLSPFTTNSTSVSESSSTTYDHHHHHETSTGGGAGMNNMSTTNTTTTTTTTTTKTNAPITSSGSSNQLFGGMKSAASAHLYYYPTSTNHDQEEEEANHTNNHYVFDEDIKKRFQQTTNALFNRLFRFFHKYILFKSEEWTDTSIFGIELQSDEKVIYVDRPQYTRNIVILFIFGFFILTLFSFTPIFLFQTFYKSHGSSSLDDSKVNIITSKYNENQAKEGIPLGDQFPNEFEHNEYVDLFWTQLFTYTTCILYIMLFAYFLIYRLLYLKLYCTRYILTNKRAIITGVNSYTDSTNISRGRLREGDPYVLNVGSAIIGSDGNSDYRNSFKTKCLHFLSRLWTFLKFSNALGYQSWSYEDMSDIYFCLHNSSSSNSAIVNTQVYQTSGDDDGNQDSMADSHINVMGSIYFGYKIENRILPFSVASYACPAGFIMVSNVYRVLDIILQQNLTVPAQARLVREDFQDCPTLKPVLFAKTAACCGFTCFKMPPAAGKISEERYKGYTHNFSFSDTMTPTAPRSVWIE